VFLLWREGTDRLAGGTYRLTPYVSSVQPETGTRRQFVYVIHLVRLMNGFELVCEPEDAVWVHNNVDNGHTDSNYTRRLHILLSICQTETQIFGSGSEILPTSLHMLYSTRRVHSARRETESEDCTVH
jgi:hypothetical protein